MTKRIIAIMCAIAFLFTCTIGRIGYIIFSGDYTVSSGYNSYSLTISKNYETIYDCNMKKLNNNKNTLVAVIRPNENCLAELKKLFSHKETENIIEELSKGYPVVKEIDHYAGCEYIQIFEIQKSENSALLRFVQQEYNDVVFEKKINFAVDAKGRLLEGDSGTVTESDENSSKGVALTIDTKIQQAVEDAAKNMKKGAVVVMDVNTSDILALYSAPDDYMNRAVTPYTVGSVFKLVISACALENEVNQVYTCTGSVTVGDTTFKCQNEKAHGSQGMKEALANSCNCYFIELALKLGKESVFETASSLGFGGNNQLIKDLIIPNGNLPGVEELRSKGQLSLLGFGQGALTATPLSFCTAVCAMVNGGQYSEAKMILGEVDEEGTLIAENSAASKNVLKQSTSDTLCEYMRYVVTNGTGSSAEYNKSSAGKTSTAQSGRYENEREILNTWFAGFYPYDNPKYAVVVLTEDGTSGASDCCPIYREIVKAIG